MVATRVGLPGTSTCISQMAYYGLVWSYDPARHLVEDRSSKYLGRRSMLRSAEEELTDESEGVALCFPVKSEP